MMHFVSDHQNFFGLDEHVGPVAVSVKREKLDPNKRANNLGKADYGTYHFRIICRTTEVLEECHCQIMFCLCLSTLFAC